MLPYKMLKCINQMAVIEQNMQSVNNIYFYPIYFTKHSQSMCTNLAN